MIAQLQFDPTISLGSMMAGASICLVLLGMWWSFTIRLERFTVQADTRLGNLEEDVKSTQVEMHSMRSRLEQVAIIQQKLVDGKERMDSLEERMRVMEGRH